MDKWEQRGYPLRSTYHYILWCGHSSTSPASLKSADLTPWESRQQFVFNPSRSRIDVEGVAGR